MKYFAYGSNLNLEQMLTRCSDASPITQAILNGYELVYRRSVATIEKSTSRSKVYGAIYDISARDLTALDRYEGYPHLYYRKFIQVEAKGLGNVKAMTYVMHKKFDKEQPTEFYYNTIKQGYQDWALPLKFLERSIQ